MEDVPQIYDRSLLNNNNLYQTNNLYYTQQYHKWTPRLTSLGSMNNVSPIPTVDEDPRTIEQYSLLTKQYNTHLYHSYYIYNTILIEQIRTIPMITHITKWLVTTEYTLLSAYLLYTLPTYQTHQPCLLTFTQVAVQQFNSPYSNQLTSITSLWRTSWQTAGSAVIRFRSWVSSHKQKYYTRRIIHVYLKEQDFTIVSFMGEECSRDSLV